MHQKEGFLVVTSFRTEHNHGPVPVEPSCIKRNSQCSLLADVGSRHPSSPESSEKGIHNKRSLQCMNKPASNTKFKRKLSVKLHSNHPLIDILKYRSRKFGCMARFAAIDLGGELHVNALNLAHNHICSSKLVSAYAKKS
ncbi:unnamed protein product [Schistocephalus solidus]|uniref:Protein FAR1-RELATED SEQUENCE n=1 Tax=Schistocephalus solidus TaxID=70667 RepID=A0A183T908_SCHSO|nr:unnamed protein product [Schistocephalus solidus]